MEPFQITVHTYPSATSSTTHAYEHTTSRDSPVPHNALLFIHGLGDGPHAVPYVGSLAARLPPSYSLFEIRLRSAYSAFGYGSLAQDVDDIAALIRYLRGSLHRRRVVLMGHSTGCQDCVAYAATDFKEREENVDGFVLQGPVSDREALGMVLPNDEAEESVAWARDRIAEGKGREAIMPARWMPKGFGDGPVTAYRWWSLAGQGGDDDFFSSDLPDEKVHSIWGRLRQPVLILPSGQDEYVPAHVDVAGMVARWRDACGPGLASPLGGLIPGANHRVDDPAAQAWMAERVVGFLGELETRAKTIGD